jgi:hypothetical protein
MFRDLVRIKNRMQDNEMLNLLTEINYGVLGTISSNGYPYTVPLNYIFHNNKIYFHCAKIGHKIDNILFNDKVSFTVVGEEQIIPEEFSTKYKSITLFGRAKVIPWNKEILFEIIKKYSPNHLLEGKEYIDNEYDSALIIEIEIDHITGKERK